MGIETAFRSLPQDFLSACRTGVCVHVLAVFEAPAALEYRVMLAWYSQSVLSPQDRAEDLGAPISGIYADGREMLDFSLPLFDEIHRATGLWLVQEARARSCAPVVLELETIEGCSQFFIGEEDDDAPLAAVRSRALPTPGFSYTTPELH